MHPFLVSNLDKWLESKGTRTKKIPSQNNNGKSKPNLSYKINKIDIYERLIKKSEKKCKHLSFILYYIEREWGLCECGCTNAIMYTWESEDNFAELAVSFRKLICASHGSKPLSELSSQPNCKM